MQREKTVHITQSYTSIAVLLCIIHVQNPLFVSSLFPLPFQEIPSEWHFELMMDRVIPVQLWAHYIEQLRTAQNIAVEDSVLLTFSLKNFVHALKAPKSFPKGTTEYDFWMWYSRNRTVVLSEKFPPMCPRSFCTISFSLHVYVDDVWWDPEQLQEDSRAYLRLLIGLFEMILAGADATHFRVLMKLFIKVRSSSFSGILFPLRRYCRVF